MRNQDQGWGYQGPVISGSQAPLGTQGTSEISGISLNQDQAWGYQVLALISLIQHSSDNGTCWPLLAIGFIVAIHVSCAHQDSFGAHL